MQNNNRNGKKAKGFYILLAGCVLVIGVSSYAFISGAIREKKATQQAGISAADKLQQMTHTEQADPAMVRTEQTQEEPPAETLYKTMLPVPGQVLREYAMEELSYNETTRDWRTHDGVDLAAAVGETVKAAANGTVSAVYEEELYGMTVEVSHADGYKTFYSGLSEEPQVQVGQIVEAGQGIGTVGDTVLVETAMESHLHFAVSKDGVSVDPAAFLYR